MGAEIGATTSTFSFTDRMADYLKVDLILNLKFAPFCHGLARFFGGVLILMQYGAEIGATTSTFPFTDRMADYLKVKLI
jgi:aconitase A